MNTVPDFTVDVDALLEGQPPRGPVHVPQPQVVPVGTSPEHLAGLLGLVVRVGICSVPARNQEKKDSSQKIDSNRSEHYSSLIANLT